MNKNGMTGTPKNHLCESQGKTWDDIELTCIVDMHYLRCPTNIQEWDCVLSVFSSPFTGVVLDHLNCSTAVFCGDSVVSALPFLISDIALHPLRGTNVTCWLVFIISVVPLLGIWMAAFHLRFPTVSHLDGFMSFQESISCLLRWLCIIQCVPLLLTMMTQCCPRFSTVTHCCDFAWSWVLHCWSLGLPYVILTQQLP